MRIFTILIFCLVTNNAWSQSNTPPLKSNNGNYFYSIKSNQNSKLMIFLHGGVSDPYFQQPIQNISIDYLLENNTEFIPEASKNGFDVMLPITNDSLNWKDFPEKAFVKLKSIISHEAKKYKEIYISGFSDGGTGSYKIFYQNPDFFEGLIVFSGFPQHQNFYKNVNYSSVTDKKIVFMGTQKDKVIPYEFLITEYCRQKKYNSNTFLYVTSGSHSFKNFTQTDVKQLFEILSEETQNYKFEPIQGFIKNDQLIAFYVFRKKILRKYAFGKQVYLENKKQQKRYKK